MKQPQPGSQTFHTYRGSFFFFFGDIFVSIALAPLEPVRQRHADSRETVVLPTELSGRPLSYLGAH